MHHAAVIAGLITLTWVAEAAAQDKCPGPQDRGRPIAVQFESGLVEVHRTENGLVWTIEAFEAGEQLYVLEVAHGTHLLSYVEMAGGTPIDGSRVSYDYGLSVPDMPVPSPAGRWQVDVRVTDSSGVFPEGQMQAYGAITDLTIGACSYQMIPVLIAYDTDDLYVEQINYLPELGIGYLVDSQTATDPGGPIPASAIWLAE
jgi:hypothetical protein